jgi:hypothetical protein
MMPRLRPRTWIGIAALLAAIAGAVFVLGWVQDEGTTMRATPDRPVAPCAFHSAVLMPVAETKALGYANTTRCLVDASGTVWIAVRSKQTREYSICLVRAAAPWRAGMSVATTWIEDRDSLLFSGAPQRVPAIAAAPDGSIHMVWYGGITGAADHQIHYARFSTAGTTRIDEERIPFRVPGFDAVAVNAPVPIELWQEHAAVAVGPDGTTHVVWEARDPFRRTPDGMPRPGIAYASRGPDGTWSVSGVLDRVPYLQVDGRISAQSRPSILVDSAGNVHVLCYGSVGGVQQILYGTVIGRGFSGWKAIAPSAGDQRHAGAAIDAAGRLHVAWREGVSPGAGVATSAIFYSERDADGRWTPPTRLSSTDENASTPAVGVTDANVSVAWVAWTPGAANADSQVDNGFPADNSTVEGRIEVTSSALGVQRFAPATSIDAGPASYPCWAVGPANGAARPALVWTSVDAAASGDRRVNLKLGWCEPSR